MLLSGWGYYRYSPGDRRQPVPPAFGDHAWLALEGRSATLYLPVVDMGQGSASALAQAAADELDMPWDAIAVRPIPVEPEYFGNIDYRTSASDAIRRHFMPVRRLCAAARAMLLGAAADRWQVTVQECRTSKGLVLGPLPGQALQYGELVAAASGREQPQNPELLPRSQWHLVGASPKRTSLESIVTGSMRYGIDRQLPGMVYAAVASAPARELELEPMEEAVARGVEGAIDVLRLGDSVAVIASSWHAAQKSLRALDVRWSPTGSQASNHVATLAGLRAGAGACADDGDGRNAKFEYSVPMLAQMALEPINATVQVGEDAVDIWVSTQNPGLVHRRLVSELGTAGKALRIHPEVCGGGFGRRLQVDYVLTAVRIGARAGGRPVKVIWSREQDTASSHGRPAARMRAQVSLRRGVRRVERIRAAIEVLGTPDARGLDPSSYRNLRLDLKQVASSSTLRTGPWRSVAYSQNLFFLEALANDVARLRGEDPFDLRKRWLGDNSRAQRVLDAATHASGWRSMPSAGPAHRRGQGLAIAECFGSAIAVVVQVHLPAPGQVHIERIVAVADVGLVVNPDAVRAQIVGGMHQALSATAKEAMEVDDVGIVPANLDRYALLRMSEAPDVEVLLLNTESGTPGGAGEIGVPPFAPAMVDAITSAGGPCIRSLPLSSHGLVLV